MKKVLILSLLALVAMGCQKTENTSGPADKGAFMRFTASTEAVRATFPDQSGQMYWSSYDHIGAYSFAADGSLVLGDFCAMDTFDRTEASFISTKERTAWVGTKDGIYTFYAYYPAVNEAAKYTDGAINVPATQTGEFGRYQICCSAGVEISRTNVVAGNAVQFVFQPATSMIRVRLTLSSDSEVDEIYIRQLIVSASNAALTGDAKLTLGNGTLSDTETQAASIVTVNLPTTVKVTKTTAEGEYIALVILPTKVSGNLSFTAVTRDNLSLTTAQKAAPSTGFNAATRYNLDREIKVLHEHEDSSPDASYVDGDYVWENEVVNDGSYTDGGYAW